ncbi:MAG: DUF3131 domain-containing protein, partial [Pseudomonadota bacterium]
MSNQSNTSRRSWIFGAVVFASATAVLGGTAWGIGGAARDMFLFREEEEVPIVAGGALDRIPALMRGNQPVAMTSLVRDEPQRQKPPRMCEMSENHFDQLDLDAARGPGYDRRNAYVRNFTARRGLLTDREMTAARVAWRYFENFTQENTGLANSVGNYPSTTLWDTASYVAGAVAAYELCIIEKPEFDQRIMRLLTTIKGLDLFRGEMPNKVYHTQTGAKVDYTNKPGEIGFSALDIGRFLVWMRILKNRYPYMANTIDSVLLKWDY